MNTLLTSRTGRILAATGCLIASTAYSAQAAPGLPPGVPEPGLIIWGSVVNTTNTAQQISVTSASWAVTDGTKNAIYTQQTRPPVRTFTQGGQSYYMVEVPFDTRRFGTIQLDDPASEGVSSFELMNAAPPTYTMAPTINGVVANIRSIDGGPAAGSSFPVAGFNATVRGRVIRVDLSITPTVETYEQWAIRIFGNNGGAAAAPGSDPDNDGLNNAGEYAAGTNPLDPSSALRLLQVTLNANQATASWQSVASKQYVLESSASINGPWTDAASVQASGGVAQASVTRNPADPQTFYRIRVAAP